MAYASITYTSASGTTFALTNSSGDPIPYLRQADIAVTVNGTLKTQGTDYTFNSAGTAIVFSVAVSNATVSISRITDISDATVVYTAGSTLTAQDLNNADNQIRFGLQEFSDTYAALTTGTGDLQVLGGFIGSAETWTADNAHAATTGAIDGRIDSKIDTALTTDVVAGDSLTITDNSPASGQITIGVTNASISTAKLVDSSVTTAKIADGNVTTAKILDSNVTTAKIADSNVTTAKIADSAVTSAKIADGTIVASDLASDAVTTAKILDANVTTGKIADGAVTTGKLADSSVTSGKIADGTIVAGDLASDSVTTAKILDANVTTAKIADSNVTTGKIADSAVTAIKIADGVITSAKLNASTVVTNAEQSASTPDDTSFFTTSASDARYDARYVNVTGDTMSGALAMGNNKITGLGTPTANADAATKLYVDNSVAAGVGDADYGDITVSGTGTVWTIDSGVVTSAKIANDTIVNADINSAAAIAHTKLANITAGSVLMGNASNVPTATALSGDVTIDSSGVTAISSGVIVNADVNASAAIAGTKISPDFGSQNTTTTGTSTAASFSPTSSTAPTNGVYLPSANNVAISTNGTGRLFVDASGNVGLGGAPKTWSGGAIGALFNGSGSITAFSDEVSYGNNVYFNGAWRYARSDTAQLLQLGSGDVPLIFYSAASGTADASITWSERFRIDSSGRLGLGTSSVRGTSLLDARGDISFGSNATYYGLLSYNAATGHIETTSSDGGFKWIRQSGPATSMTLDSSGRLGIGTSSPTNTLHVSGTGSTQAIFERTGSTGTFIGLKDSATQTFIGNTNGVFSIQTPGSSYSDKLVVTSAGNVGIGSTAPNYELQINASDAVSVIQLTNTSTGATASDGLLIYNNGVNAFISNEESGFLKFQTAGAERAQIDASGRLLVGTSSSPTVGDAQYGLLRTQGNTSSSSGFGILSIARGLAPASITSGAEIGYIHFTANDGSPFARIECSADANAGANDYPGRLVFSTTADGASSPTERMRIRQNGEVGIFNSISLYPNTDNSVLLGANGYRWSAVWAANGTIQTSDERAKTAVEDSALGADFIKSLRPVSYKWVEGGKRHTGEYDEDNNFIYESVPGTRTHWGFIAQEVKQIVDAAGVDFGGWVLTDKDDPDSQQALRYDQFIAPLTKALQEALAKIETLEAKVAALEAS